MLEGVQLCHLRPYQCKLGYSVNIQFFDNSTHTFTSLECKEHVKYLGILLDSNLSWKFHIEYVALKITKVIGVITIAPFLSVLF